MTDSEKFEGFKQNLINENEKQYGSEIRQKYGDATIDASNKKLMGLSEENYAKATLVESEIKQFIFDAISKNDHTKESYQKLYDLHKTWLCFFWKDYTLQMHLGLVEMYTQDERFAKYYDNIIQGGTDYIYKAINSIMDSE